MSDSMLIIFSFPRTTLLELDIATRMAKAQDIFADAPDVHLYSVVGGTADKIVKNLKDNPDDEPSHLVLHAMRELSLAGNDKEFNDSIIAAVEGFASYGHSGGSAEVAIQLLHDLLQYKNLTELTDDKSEWMQVEMGDEACWQSVRNPEAFSKNEGKTYYLLSEGGNSQNPRPLHNTRRIYTGEAV